MQAVNKVLSLDQQAFPSLNGLPGETLHSVSCSMTTSEARVPSFCLDRRQKLSLLPFSPRFQYIEDENVANNPWHGFEQGYLKVCILIFF